MDAGDYDWYMALHKYLVDDQGMSQEDVDEFFTNMASNAAFLTGHTSVRQLLVAGEYHVMASDYSYGVQAALEDGAPIAWQPPVEPLFARPNGVALAQGGQNPAGGILFYDWILNAGQEVLKSVNVDPVRADLASTGDADLRLLDVEVFLEEEEMWVQAYDELALMGEAPKG